MTLLNCKLVWIKQFLQAEVSWNSTNEG